MPTPSGRTLAVAPLMNQALGMNQQARLAYSRFQPQDTAAFKPILMGLTQRRRINDVNEEVANIGAGSGEGTPWIGRL